MVLQKRSFFIKYLQDRDHLTFRLLNDLEISLFCRCRFFSPVFIFVSFNDYYYFFLWLVKCMHYAYEFTLIVAAENEAGGKMI